MCFHEAEANESLLAEQRLDVAMNAAKVVGRVMTREGAWRR